MTQKWDSGCVILVNQTYKILWTFIVVTPSAVCPKYSVEFTLQHSGTSQAPVNIRCGKFLHVDQTMITISQRSRTSIALTKMETERGDILTSVPTVSAQ